MRKLVKIAALAVVICGWVVAEGKGLQLQDLPAVVQKAVQDNLLGGVIKNIGKEKEDGIVQYEIESERNGKARYYNVDIKGNLLLVEEATTIDAIPAAAKASILRKIADGKLLTVETFTKTGVPTMYEASYQDRRGKKHEVLVKADGIETKE